MDLAALGPAGPSLSNPPGPAGPAHPNQDPGSTAPASVSAGLQAAILAAIEQAGGWLPFDRYMAMALYTPGLGYYANGATLFGRMPESGSDFVTAPELSPAFGQALAVQVGQALQASGSDEIWEFGAGSGALAAQLLAALDAAGQAPRRYTIVDLSASLRQRQQDRLRAQGDRVRWVDEWPMEMAGVVVGNEVLDAMPVSLLQVDGSAWRERGVAAGAGRFVWADRPTALRPPLEGQALLQFTAGTVVEIQPQREAFIATLAERLTRGAAFFIDYGFPAAEFYHPDRTGGTLMCHRAHRADTDPLTDVGLKDITTHVDFSGVALAGQAAGLEVLGYTSQAHFLINCGVMELLEGADLPALAHAQKLLTEHEMGELFKVIGFAKGCDAGFMADPIGFRRGDRTHTL